jgi:hypothetical protein
MESAAGRGARVTTSLELKERHRQVRDGQPEALRLRIHRALSWLLRAERETGDDDARFVFQWIALNAAYAREFSREETERERVRGFIATLVALDAEKRLHRALFEQFTGPIRTLIDKKFAFEPFWTALRTHDPSERWKQGFDGAKKAAMASIMAGDTATVLGIVFDRLYVLRNQLVHGGATWNGQTNRAQVEDAVAILGALVPLIVEIMMEHPQQDYGAVLYPVV